MHFIKSRRHVHKYILKYNLRHVWAPTLKLSIAYQGVSFHISIISYELYMYFFSICFL